MITSNATRQLYAAAGLLPEHVHLSEWLEAGTAYLLEQSDTPYIDPLPNKAATMAVGVGVGYGSATIGSFVSMSNSLRLATQLQSCGPTSQHGDGQLLCRSPRWVGHRPATGS